MPVYAYACRDCGNAFDIRQEFTDESLTVCESCGGRLRKQFGAVGVTFNGSGFYRTDSRSSPTSSQGSATKAPTQSAPPAAAPATAQQTGSTS
ncbi:FmdB family zinc ribbon protein [Agrococcus casei]|uniref:FmdB family zinc ribbon protein n=1 Tax=Agrococcus casei TaxID=343512 RepID=UPI000B351AE9|nr:FmdB family zinc ribbon protein [Agrococcus casei]